MNNETASPGNARKRRIIITAASALMGILVLAAALFLWQSHIHNMRNEMDSHYENSIEYLEQGFYSAAAMEATQALALATRLSDDDAYGRVNALILLIEELTRAADFFEMGRYHIARTSYIWAHDYALAIESLDKSFIFDLIETTDGFIYFYELIDYADSLAAADELESALVVYEGALQVATSLFFSDGEILAYESITYTDERISLGKLSRAQDLESLGDSSFLSGNYFESITIFRDALDLYIEVDNTPGILSVNTKINAAEFRLEQVAIAQALEEEEARLAEEARIAQESSQADESNISYPPESRPIDSTTQARLSNYEHNLSLFFDLFTLIDDQSSSPANQIRLGSRDGLNEGWYNGCGWVAAYNALIMLQSPLHPAEIVLHFEDSGGTVLDGVFGTFPHAVERLFIDLGHDVTHSLFPLRSGNIDDSIRASTVSILAYSHTRAAHFIAVQYRESDGRFVVLNDSFARRRAESLGLQDSSYVGASVDSIAALVRETPEILFSFSLITIR